MSLGPWEPTPGTSASKWCDMDDRLFFLPRRMRTGGGPAPGMLPYARDQVSWGRCQGQAQASPPSNRHQLARRPDNPVQGAARNALRVYASRRRSHRCAWAGTARLPCTSPRASCGTRRLPPRTGRVETGQVLLGTCSRSRSTVKRPRAQGGLHLLRRYDDAMNGRFSRHDESSPCPRPGSRYVLLGRTVANSRHSMPALLAS
jgi:hypothetical protein